MKTLSALLCAICASAFICGCKPAPTIATKWEYKTVEADNYAHAAVQEAYLVMKTNSDQGLRDIRSSENSIGGFWMDDLYKYGQDGWELVAAVPQIETVDAKDYDDRRIANVRTGKIILLFKRPEK